MDLRKMDSFLDYQPVFDENSISILNKIIEQAKKYLPDSAIQWIQKAYEVAHKAHFKVKRLSWEPYIVHPLKATIFLMEINPDLESIQACILHDVIEDTSLEYKDIEKDFGKWVANLCESLVKVSKVRYRWEDRQIETLKKTFIAMAKDLRVIFIKLADRIHNLQTLHYHPKIEKRKRIATESMKIYVSIAKRLWLYHFQLYLENAAFKILYEEDFTKIFNYMKKSFWVEKRYKDKWIKILTNLLKKEGIEWCKVEWRIKSPRRVYEKMKHKYQSTDISDVLDLLAYRIIAKNESDCYMILGAIHKYYTPLIKKIKDYIAIPKSNNYRSIHTTVLGIFRFPTEIQIRTEEMDEIAKYGVAAHFKYSEDKKSSIVSKSKSDRIKRVQELVEQYQSLEEKEQFKNKLNIEILDKSIFLYTPQWDVIEMPKESTVLDFAFRIHSRIWLSFKNALVNWEIKPISFTPKTWDMIQINTFKNKYSANKHRLEYLHTPSAKSQLNKHLRILQKEELIKKEIEKLNQKLKIYKLPKYDSEQDKIKEKYNEKELNELLIQVLDKKTTYDQIIKQVYPKKWKEKHEKKQKTIITDKKEHEVIVDRNKHINYSLCPECSPTKWNKIIARTWKDGIKIHRINCKALKTINFSKLLEAHRDGEKWQLYKAQISLEIKNTNKDMIKIIRLFSALHITIIQIIINEETINHKELTLNIQFQNPSKIALLLYDLKKHKNSIKLLKKKFI